MSNYYGYAALARTGGRRTIRHLVGDIIGDTGDIISTLFNAGGELTKKVVTNVQQQQQSQTQQRQSAADLDAAIAADNAAVDALTDALVSTDAKLPQADADKALSDQALAAEDAAAAGLSPDQQKKRGDAARKVMVEAQKGWKANPTSKTAKFRAQAAQTIYMKTQNALVKSDASGGGIVKSSSGSWFTRRVLGPIPGWGVLVGGVVGGAAAIALTAKLVRR